MDKAKNSILYNSYIEKSIQYMNAFVFSKLTLKQLADNVNLSKCHYVRVFKEVTGHSPIQYLTKLKINKASELLATTDMSINDISEQLGFGSSSHFYNTFKKQKIIAPLHYRKKYSQHSNFYLVDMDENLHRSLFLLNTILDATTDLIFYKDTNGFLLGCNAAFSRVMGIDKEEIIGKSDCELFSQIEADFFREKDLAVYNTGLSIRNTEWMTLPDGTINRYEVVKSPFYDSSGVLLGLIGISRNTTEILHGGNIS